LPQRPNFSSGLTEKFCIKLATLKDTEENPIVLIYKEIQSGAVAKSYMRKGFLIDEEMRK
jgi:hypothetical protein